MALVSRRPARGIQTALYQRLSTDTQLQALGAAVLDYVDEDRVRPRRYITIGEISTESPNNAHDMLGMDTTVYVHVWDDDRTWDWANDVADRVVQLVDHQPMTVPDQRVISVRFEFGQNIPGEGTIRHVPLRFRITTETEEA